MNKVVRSMPDLESALTNAPISRTPPYFAETDDKDKVSIIFGDAETFDFDNSQEPDNKWIANASKKFDSKSQLRYFAGRELAEIRQAFQIFGFRNSCSLPAEVDGLISWIFVNNAMSAGFDSEGKPLLYFGRMKNLCRLPEPALAEFYLKKYHEKLLDGIRIERASMYTMEGKGDQLPMSLPVIRNGKQCKNEFYHIIINCSGRRTDQLALEEYVNASGNFVVEIPLSDDPATGAYHGNVAIMYYQDKECNRGVIYVPDMLREDSKDFVYEMFKTFFGKDHVYKITQDVPDLYKESIKLLSMNGISLSKGRLISAKHSRLTNDFLRKKIGLNILEIDIPAISTGGGGLQCCYTALNKKSLELIK